VAKRTYSVLLNTLFKNALAENADTCRKAGVKLLSGNVNASSKLSYEQCDNRIITQKPLHDGLNITCTPEQKDALPFMETDIEAVVKLVLKDHEIQLAMSSGAASKWQATHFGDDLGNIFGIQAKGTDDGVTQRQKVMEKGCYPTVMINNNTITSNVLASGTSNRK
jgi:hypothetical protein